MSYVYIYIYIYIFTYYICICVMFMQTQHTIIRYYVIWYDILWYSTNCLGPVLAKRWIQVWLCLEPYNIMSWDIWASLHWIVKACEMIRDTPRLLLDGKWRSCFSAYSPSNVETLIMTPWGWNFLAPPVETSFTLAVSCLTEDDRYVFLSRMSK